MTGRFVRKAANILASARLAIGLLVFVAVWSFLATLVPQGGASAPEVRAFAASHAALEPLVHGIGLHLAFLSPLFIACIALLAVSTAICACRRTALAVVRTRMLWSAAKADSASVGDGRRVEIPCGPDRSPEDILQACSKTLEDLGVRTKRRGDVLASVSPGWAVWGSPLFHWSLLALIVAAAAGNLVRSDGSIALAMGETKPDTRSSYVSVTTGPLHRWGAVTRAIRLDSFEPDYKTGGIDRGAVPTVSLLDASKRVIGTQRVYQNMKLHDGSLSVNAPACGLAVHLGLLDGAGTQVGQAYEYADFSQTTSGGTVPLGDLARRDSSGRIAMRMVATVPLDRSGSGYGEWIPRSPSARVQVRDAEGKPLLDRVIQPGEVATLPGGGSIRLLGVGWYSRLSLVDDPSVPFVYAAMVVAGVGLALGLARQQLVVVAVLDGTEGRRLVADVRLWRNVPATTTEIESALRQSVGGEQNRSA